MKTCWYHRKRVEWNMGEGQLPPSTADHLRHCSDCETACKESLDLTASLKQSRVQTEPSPFLMGRILAHLNTPASRGWRFSWQKLALGTASIGIAGIFLFQSRHDRPGSMETKASLPTSEIVIPQLPKVSTFAKKIDDPLELEIQRVIQDTRHAYQHVASNFLPSNRE